jgi:hypothetical protein
MAQGRRVESGRHARLVIGQPSQTAPRGQCRGPAFANYSADLDEVEDPGVPLTGSIGAVTEHAAVAAAARFGGPVALRADVPRLVQASAPC